MQPGKTFLVLALLALSSLALAQDGPNLVLHGAVLMDSGNSDNDRRVSIVISEGLVELLTEDAVGDSNETTDYDAKGGFVLGNLALGQPAAFLILSADPRQRPGILLNTHTHASFGISAGEVIRNYLPAYQEDESTYTYTSHALIVRMISVSSTSFLNRGMFR